jgi:TonB family protein
MTTRRFAVRLTQTAALLLLGVGLSTFPSYGQDPVSIFDGSSLKGWKVEHTRANARTGVLTVQQGAGWVRSEQVFADFVLRLEVRLIGPDAKAGVFVRAWPTFDEKSSVPNNGYRIMMTSNVPAGAAGDPADAWRRLEIECAGHTLRVHIDGVLVHAVDTIENPQGYIALSTQEGTAEFRTIEVRRHSVRSDSAVADRKQKLGDGVFVPGDGIENPRVSREVKPRYTAAAIAARIQGAVLLEAIVLPDGTVGEAFVVRSLDPRYGLDREALAAAKAWRFTPATRMGQPVAVLVTIELTFTLK